MKTLSPLAENLKSKYPQDFQDGAIAQHKIEQGLHAGNRANAIWHLVNHHGENKLSLNDLAFWFGQEFGTI